MARPALRDRPEHGERALGILVGRRGGPLPGRQGAPHPGRPLGARALEPARVAQEPARHGAVHQRVLPHVERGQVEAERLHTPLESPQGEQPRMDAAVAGEASAHDVQVGCELVGARVAVGLVPLGGGEPRGHESEQHPVRHVAIARGHGLESDRETGRIVGRALEDGVVYVHARAGLGESLRQFERLLLVALEHQRAVAGQGGADRVGGHVGIAVHVATHPGPESQHGRYGNFRAGAAVHRGERVRQLLVEGRHDAIHDVGQEEQHVLQLVEHGGALGGLRLGLPGDGDFFPDAAQRRAVFGGRERRIEPPHEQPADDLLLLE